MFARTTGSLFGHQGEIPNLAEGKERGPFIHIAVSEGLEQARNFYGIVIRSAHLSMEDVGAARMHHGHCALHRDWVPLLH